ncbi:transcription factor Sp2-like isoform X2 [Sycon ciliatum]|uniref:transcription factor Sp2-like isoform X2 n=1 Tax=Sycon ciliatum TaxID=27933 RepID=UPI0031F5FC49
MAHYQEISLPPAVHYYFAVPLQYGAGGVSTMMPSESDAISPMAAVPMSPADGPLYVMNSNPPMQAMIMHTPTLAMSMSAPTPAMSMGAPTPTPAMSMGALTPTQVLSMSSTQVMSAPTSAMSMSAPTSAMSMSAPTPAMSMGAPTPTQAMTMSPLAPTQAMSMRTHTPTNDGYVVLVPVPITHPAATLPTHPAATLPIHGGGVRAGTESRPLVGAAPSPQYATSAHGQPMAMTQQQQQLFTVPGFGIPQLTRAAPQQMPLPDPHAVYVHRPGMNYFVAPPRQQPPFSVASSSVREGRRTTMPARISHSQQPFRADTPASSSSHEYAYANPAGQQHENDDDDDDDIQVGNVTVTDEDEIDVTGDIDDAGLIGTHGPSVAQQAPINDTPADSENGSEIEDYVDDGISHEDAIARQNLLAAECCIHTDQHGRNVYVCPEANHSHVYRYRRHLEQHFLTHLTNEKKALCHICGKIFTRTDHLSRHAIRHNCPVLPCQLCDKTFPDASKLFKHWKSMHPHQKYTAPLATEDDASSDGEDDVSSDGEDDVSSDGEDDVSSDGEQLPVSTTEDQQGDSEQLPVSTPEDQQGDTSAPVVRKRKRSSQGGPGPRRRSPKDPVYQETSFGMARLACLVEPPIPVGGRRSHVCKVCHMAFGRNSHLDRHALTHTGETPYHCIVCNGAFNRQDYLQTHMIKQHNKTPMQCEHCSMTFPQISLLVSHLRVQHRAKAGFLKAQPTEDAEAQPVEDAEAQPVEHAETQPVEDAEAQPVEDAEAQPVEDAEAQPVEDTEDSEVQ